MEENIFDIAFTSKGQQYEGWVNPSDKLDDKGKPISFHVVLNGTSFGYLSFNNCKWNINEERPKELVDAVAKAIEKRYSL